MKREYILLVVCFSLLIIISACAVLENETNNKTEQPSVEDSKEQKVASANRADIHTLEYGDQMGLELYPPKNKVATSMPLQGEIDESDELNEDYVWVVIRKKDHMDDISDKEFEYYIPIEDGQFSKELNLHHGKGEYNVNVRLPSNEENEEDTYYDAAEYQINNLEEDIERDVEISKFGHEKGIELADDINGWNKAEQAFQINGTVGEDYNESEILAEVEKDNEQHNIIIPIEDGSFSDEIPLNYGKGVHSIRLQLKDEEENEDLYYESANLYVDNQSDQELLEFNEYEDYVDSGVMLESPSQKTGMELNEVEYPIKGTIDEDA